MISNQLSHPPESQVAPMDYSKIREMISAIEKEQQRYCTIKDQYLDLYRVYDVEVRALEHKADLHRHAKETILYKMNQLRSLESVFSEIKASIL